MHDVAIMERLEYTEKVDRLQAALATLPQVDCPLEHRFTPGLYSRTILMLAGTLIISKIHKTEHQFVVTKGRASVWTEENGVVEVKAGHVGITKPGTRRILYIHENCVWTTFHPSNKTTVEEVEEEIILKHDVSDIIPGDIMEELRGITKEVLCLG